MPSPSPCEDDTPTGQFDVPDDSERRFFRRVGAVLLLAGLGYLLWQVLAPLWQVPDLGGRFLFELPWVERLLEQLSATTHLSLARLHAWVMDGFRHILGRIAASSGSIAHGATGALVELFLMLFVLFFVLRDGPGVARATVRLLPIDEQRRERLRQHVVDATRAVFKGIGLTALVHGFLIGVGCWIAGLPAPLVLGVVAAVLALVPVVGSALVWMPATLYLLAQGEHGQALFLGIYSIALVGAVDHVLRPLLISGHADIPAVVVFLGVLGGLAAFGLIGLFVGPIVLGLAVALFRYETETQAVSRTGRSSGGNGNVE